jgi:hypothetical protein
MSVGCPKKHKAPLTTDKDYSNENNLEEGVFERGIPTFFKAYNKQNLSTFVHSNSDIAFSKMKGWMMNIGQPKGKQI